MNKKGISAVSLAISVVILLVIVSSISISITYSVSNAKKLTFAKEIYNIQSVVTEYIQKENVLPASMDALQIKPEDIEQFENENIVDGNIFLNVLDLSELEIKNTVYGNKEIGDTLEAKEKDVYAVSPKTGKVYYVAGFESNDKTYYTLTDELAQMIDKKQNLLLGEKTLFFTPSKVGWSNEGIQVTVFVPKDYIDPSITIDNANISYTEESNIDGNTYVVNSAKVLENYTITIEYIKDETTNTARYTTKIDNVAPVIENDTNISNTQTHVNGLNAIDTQSGIKYFKYVEGVIDASDAKTYINEYGKNLKNGSIKFSKKVAYTLYAEDKAGNYTVMYLDDGGNLTQIKPIYYKYPIIPDGFTVSSVPGETRVSEGIVIYEGTEAVTMEDKDNNGIIDAQEDRNQYVWIPVPDFKKFELDESNKYIPGEWVPGKEWFYYDDLNLDTLDVADTKEYYNDEIQQYKAMKESVSKYGGFYIARYEAGLPEGVTSENANYGQKAVGTPLTSPVSKKNANVWNNIPFDVTEIEGKAGFYWFDWGETLYYGSDTMPGSAKVAKEAYRSEKVTSHLMYGIQWDTAILFLISINGEKFTTQNGWFPDNYLDGNPEHKTGIDVGENALNKIYNVYDMAGNVEEWTYHCSWTFYENNDNEMGSNDFYCTWRMSRGGNFIYEWAANMLYANPVPPSIIDETIGFRVALCLK